LLASVLAAILNGVNDVTRVLAAIDAGDPHAPEELLPLVYDELRKLAAGHMANESPGHTLEPTGLVHEAYLRLVENPGEEPRKIEFGNRAHFFAAAAEAMRRILVDSARRKHALKRGGHRGASPLELDQLPSPSGDVDSRIDLDAVLSEFEGVDGDAAGLAKLRIFGGLSVEQAGAALNMSRATAFRLWTYARAWLTAALADRPKNT
jgi:RNA polymerase sigma factor (TIGR02999 family)